MSLTLEDVVKLYLVILTSYSANLKRAKPLLVPTPKKLKSARNCAAFAFFFCLHPCFVDLVIENRKFHTEQFLFYSGLKSVIDWLMARSLSDRRGPPVAWRAHQAREWDGKSGGPGSLSWVHCRGWETKLYVYWRFWMRANRRSHGFPMRLSWCLPHSSITKYSCGTLRSGIVGSSVHKGAWQ